VKSIAKGGFLTMVLSILGVVLFVSMFSSILTAIGAVLDYANVTTFIALEVVCKIAPTVLLLAGVGVAGFGYYKGLKTAGGNDPGGMLRMVLGVLVIILFCTLFLTILESFYTLYSAANASYIAFQTVASILPTILFISGIFAGTTTAVSGYRARRKGKKGGVLRRR